MSRTKAAVVISTLCRSRSPTTVKSPTVAVGPVVKAFRLVPWVASLMIFRAPT
ncbi:Uncharacterised protein [Mycobacteroides abscessus subsp. abscessus]|nr:Uncharacterised protein [Mycobacteroides abscessus subsp. abscessus]SKV18955.1 Uncharacterised protein [Mycobacteroides abscessus subsp. abscessus]